MTGEVARLGIVVTTQGGETAIRTLKGLEESGKRAEAQATKFSGSARKLGEEVGRLGGSVARGSASFDGAAVSLARMSVAAGPVGIAIGAVAAALAGAGLAAEQYARSQKDLELSLYGLGQTAGVTADALEQMAQRTAGAATLSIASAREIVAAYTRMGVGSADVIENLTRVTDDYAAVTGQKAVDAAKDLGEAFADPANGAEELDKRLALLDDRTLQLIKSMAESGDRAGAQAILMRELGDEVDGAAGKVTGLAGAWRDLKKAMSDAASGFGAGVGQFFSPDQTKVAGDYSGFGYSPVLEAEKARVASANAAAQSLATEKERIRLSKEAGDAVRDLLPKEQALLEVQNQRALIQRALAAGALSNADATRALAAADAKVVEINRDRKAEAAAAKAAAEARREMAKAAREAARAEEEFRRALEATRSALSSEWASASKQATDQMRVLNEAFDKGLVTADELSEANLKLAGNYELVGEVAPEVTGEIKTMSDALRDSGIAVEDLQGNVEFAANQMSDAFYSVANAIDSVLYSLKSGDWGGALSGLLRTVSTIKASISEIGVLGTAGNVAGIVGSALGGKTGGAISSIGGGLGIAALGSVASGALANATIGAAFSGAIGGTLANAGLALSSVLGPIGIIAGIAYSLSGLLKGKPTNAGAGYDLTTGQLSGNKRTAETEEAVLAAADAIKQGQSVLTNAGLNLTDSVRGLVIGTRDESQIYLSSGKTLTSAVGDAAAATETALLALLDSATYADEQQKILVESMRAAGKGFDDITAALETYASAQGLSKTFADAILAFTDPEGYAKSQLEAEQKARRDQVQALYDELYLTAEQFASLNAQLDTLDGLELADTLSQFADSLDSLISGAQSDLQSAYEAEAAVLNETISTYTQLLNTLRDFDDSLKGQLASNASPLVAYRQSQGAFRSIAGSTDPSVLAGIPSAGQAYLQAALAIAPDKTTYARVLAEVRAGVADAEAYAESQIDTAEAQLEQLKTMVGVLISIDKGVMTVAMAITNLGTLLTQQNAASGASTLPEWFDWQKYAADNPDLAAAYNSGAALTEFGSFEEAVKQHYLLIGQAEIAAGNRKYATGGSFTVGGTGGADSQLIPLSLTPGEVVNVSKQDNMAAVVEELRALRAENAAMRAEMAATRKAAEKTESFWRGVTNDGRSINTVAA